LKEHIERLLNSADLIKLKHNFTFKQVEDAINELLKLNNDGQEKSIRVHFSGGVSNSMYQTGEPTMVIFMDPFKSKDPSIYIDGVVLNTVKYERDVPRSKNVNYVEGIIQAHTNKDKGIFEPLYYSDAQVFETSNSNIFAIKDGKLYTPKNNVFYGSARSTIINDLKNDFNIIEEDFKLDFLLNADEVFLASGGKQVAPVVKIDERVIGDGKVGKITIQVWSKFKEFVELGNW
jgi:branched-subunit amino acid aminotransferase/4-amino-4-deoxychorismate lyase